MHRRFGKRLGDDENGHSGRMIRPFDEGQPGDDLGCPRLDESRATKGLLANGLAPTPRSPPDFATASMTPAAP